MLLFVIIFGIGFVMASITLFFLYYDLKKIEAQLQFLEHTETNQVLTTASHLKVITRIVQILNRIRKKEKRQKNQILVKEKELQQAITNISHDFRTPLTTALGYMEQLQEMDSNQQNLYKIVYRKLQHLNLLIDQFFAFSKWKDNRKVTIEICNIVTLLYETIASFYPELENCKINFHIANESLYLKTNRDLLEHIYLNLLQNYIRYGEDELTITIEVEQEITLIFANKTQQNIDTTHIFDRFYTSDISRTNGGTGLGLAIVKEFTESLNGTVQAFYQKPEIAFYIRFPIEQLVDPISKYKNRKD